MGDKIRRGQLSYWVSLKDDAEDTDPRLQRHSSALESQPYFCTSANMQSAVVYLSQELQGMGLGCPLIETGGQKVNLVALVNACWEVSQLYRASVRETSILQDQRRRDTADINHFQSSIKDLRGEVDEKERLVCEAQEKERQAANGNKSLTAKLKMEKEEVRKHTSAMQQMEAHHQHELRKKENEITRLQDRLRRLVSGARSVEAHQPSMSQSAPLTRPNKSRAKWKTEATSARHEEDLYKRVLSQYEAWLGQLKDENEQLKSSLLRISSHLSKAMARYSKVESQTLPDGDLNTSMSSNYSTDSLENIIVNLEFPAFKDRLQQNFDDNMKSLVHLLEESAQNMENKNEEQLRELEKQLATTKEELASYTKSAVKFNVEKTEKTDEVFIVEGRNVEEEATLEKEKQELMKEKEVLQQERKSFTEATIRLNRERAAFEAEKGELLKGQFLQNLPPSLDADLVASGLENGGSLSSGSIGDIFDSPQRVLAMPTITSPSGTITYLQGTSVVLGPTRLSRPQHDSKKGRGSSRRL